MICFSAGVAFSFFISKHHSPVINPSFLCFFGIDNQATIKYWSLFVSPKLRFYIFSGSIDSMIEVYFSNIPSNSYFLFILQINALILWFGPNIACQHRVSIAFCDFRSIKIYFLTNSFANRSEFRFTVLMKKLLFYDSLKYYQFKNNICCIEINFDESANTQNSERFQGLLHLRFVCLGTRQSSIFCQGNELKIYSIYG